MNHITSYYLINNSSKKKMAMVSLPSLMVEVGRTGGTASLTGVAFSTQPPPNLAYLQHQGNRWTDV
jgi:hypothetical protein